MATLFGLWLYTHVFSENQRRELGLIARWLAHGPRLLLQRHGRAIGVVACAAFAGVLFLAQWIDRGEPALASGLPSGQSRSWNFVADPSGDTLVLAGDSNLIVPFLSYLLMLQVVALVLSWRGGSKRWWALRALSLAGTSLWAAKVMLPSPAPWEAAVSAGPQSLGWQGVSLDRSGSFHSSQ